MSTLLNPTINQRWENRRWNPDYFWGSHSPNPWGNLKVQLSPFYIRHQLIGLIELLSKRAVRKSISKKMKWPKTGLWTQLSSSLASLPLSQHPHNLLCGRPSFRLWIDYSSISWTGWWICLLLDVLLCLPILWIRYGSQSITTFGNLCTSYPSFCSFGCECPLQHELPKLALTPSTGQCH